LKLDEQRRVILIRLQPVSSLIQHLLVFREAVASIPRHCSNQRRLIKRTALKGEAPRRVHFEYVMRVARMHRPLPVALVPDAKVTAECDGLARVLLERPRTLPRLGVGQLEHDAPIGVRAKGFTGDWRDAGKSSPASFAPTCSSPSLPPHFVGWTSPCGTTRLRADGSQSLPAGVVRIDERLVEPEPNALALGATLKGEAGNE
jgi:hypothetical protein